MTSFIHLKLHTEYSLTDSTIRIKSLVKHALEQKMPALAITDICNFYGLIKFYQATQGAGIKPIIGTDIWLRVGPEDKHPTTVTLLAQNHSGYRNIIKLISKAFQEGQYHGKPYCFREWLGEHSEGVIVLSGGRLGDVGQALLGGHREEASALLSQWQQDFPGRFYLELQRTGRENEEAYIHGAVDLALQHHVPVVATNDVRFLSPEEFEVHEARVCIGEGRTLDDPRRERRYSEQQYLRSEQEMLELFSDIPQALENTVEIAKRCNVEIELGNYYLPDYPMPEGFRSDPFFQKYYSYEELESRAVNAMSGQWAGKEDQPEYQSLLQTNVFFQKVSFEGLYRRLEVILGPEAQQTQEARQPYIERIEFELDIVMQMGFPGYFLIVMDFIQWAKDHDIPVGPGRGSGAGSLVAYALDITDLDPLAYDLLFERFLNPERVSMPDFDIDFCMDNRDQVISYVADNYGRDAVSQIITFGTMAAKAVVRDVARVQGKSYGLADKLSKMIPMDVGMTLSKAYEQEEPLREFLATDSDAQEIWEMALKLEGVTRNVGKHAGGVVIAPTKLTDFSPLYCDESGGGLVTQYDKNDVEAAGLVKFDFLGLRTLTIVDWAVKMVNRTRVELGMEPIDISRIPLDDPETFNMLKTAETTAVFQLESRGMKDLIKRLQPDNIEDMIALVALFRPGPLQSGMVDDFINRKHGRAQVAYPDAKYQHEKLKPILEPTYGVIVYQEQVMQIAQELAGYTLGGADLLRRAMGKKKPEEMAKQREIFEAGAAKQGVDPVLAIKIFDLVEKFAGYGFNKSHSAAYAVVSYQTAWLKTHYPAQFMAATMSSDMDKTDKVVTFIEECRSMKLTLLPPDVNQGEFQFTVNRDDEIIYGLGAIKGLGEGPVDNIIAARGRGPFKDLFDFCERVDARKVNKRALEALIKSGALDTIGPDVELDRKRAILMSALQSAVKAAEQTQSNASSGMGDLFGSVVSVDQASRCVYGEYLSARAWTMKERLQCEKDTLGLYLTGHPIDEYESDVAQLTSARLSALTADKKPRKVGGLVVGLRVMKTKRGDTMAIVTLDDRTGRLEVAVFSDAFQKYRDILVKDALLIIEGQVSNDDYSGGLKMRADTIVSLDQARSEQLRAIVLRWHEEQLPSDSPSQLQQLLQNYQDSDSPCLVRIHYQHPSAKAVIQLGQQWRVKPSDDLIFALRETFGAQQLSLEYSA